MVKRAVATKTVRKGSMDQTPKLDLPRSKLNYREIKRRSIIAGLRMMKAPAALWLKPAARGEPSIYTTTPSVKLFGDPGMF
jgi:hypothetical protein